MARPQTHYSWDNKTVEGIDIMLAMDVSTSMLAEDLKPNRMEAAKDVATEFISGRPTDNIGLTIFAGEAFTQCPMTTDHASLLRLLHDTRTDIAARGMMSLSIVTSVECLLSKFATSDCCFRCISSSCLL